ncbi:hypothetical protein D3C73_991630 [compost metagenome]
MFIVQSIAPTPAPNTNSVAPSASGVGASVSSGRASRINAVVAIIKRREPSRAVNAPASGIASNEPSPRHSSSPPRLASDNPALALANGTIGAQAAVAKPGMKKAARVACCWARGEEGVMREEGSRGSPS